MTELKHITLRGGLDLVTPAIEKPAGRLIAGNNYEPHPRGIRRMDGFERYDGRAKPSDATYGILDFDAGTVAVTTGQTVTGATSGATGYAVANGVLESGSYAGSDAAGYLVLTAVTGTFQNNENLQVSAATVCVANGTLGNRGADTDALDATYLQAAIEYYRALITAVPGSGAIRGIWTYNGVVYAFRDNSGGTACVMHKATTSGWVAVSASSLLPFTLGGVWILEFDQTQSWVDFAKSNAVTPNVGDTIVQSSYGTTLWQSSKVIQTVISLNWWTGTIAQIEIDSGSFAGENAIGRLVVIASDITNYNPAAPNHFDLPGYIAQADATYPVNGYMVAYVTQVTQVKVSVGDLIKGVSSGAIGQVQRIILDDGTFEEGDAVGRFVVSVTSGTFTDEGVITGDELTFLDSRYSARVTGTGLATAAFEPAGKFSFVNYRFQNTTESLTEAEAAADDAGENDVLFVSIEYESEGSSTLIRSSGSELEAKLQIDNEASGGDTDIALGAVKGKLILCFTFQATKGKRTDTTNGHAPYDDWPDIHLVDEDGSTVNGFRFICYDSAGSLKIKIQSNGTDIVTLTPTFTPDPTAQRFEPVIVVAALDIDSGECWVTSSENDLFLGLSAPDNGWEGGGNPATGTSPTFIASRAMLNNLRIITVFPAIVDPPTGVGSITEAPQQYMTLTNNGDVPVFAAIEAAGFRLPERR